MGPSNLLRVDDDAADSAEAAAPATTAESLRVLAEEDMQA
jgi:hypothetical protein